MWCIKAQGKTYYVTHVSCEMGWNTKETPNNSHTQGSLKFTRCLIQIDSENTATIKPLTPADQLRLRDQKNIIRLMISNFGIERFWQSVTQSQIRVGAPLQVKGACSNPFLIIDIYQQTDLVYLTLNMPAHSVRVLQSNEDHYQRYQQALANDEVSIWWEEPDDEDEEV